MSFTFIVPQIAIAYGTLRERTTKRKCVGNGRSDRSFFGSAFAQRAVGNRYPSNHHIVMVKMDKIVSEKRGWVYLR